MSVSAHILSPLSKGLFKRIAFIVLNRTSCANTTDILKCLKDSPCPKSLITNQMGFLGSEGLFDNAFGLLLGNGKTIPAPLDYQNALVYLSLIFQRESLDLYRKLYFGPPTNDSNYLRSQIEKAYSDSNLLLEVTPWMGTCHGAELPNVYGYPLVAPGYSRKDDDLRRGMVKIFCYDLKVGDSGKLEKSRIEFCQQQWEGFVTRGSLQLEYFFAARHLTSNFL
uniref:Carboxylesterase type B domain-containing protein n=1 Tax=Tetranychus urticae TaxID=32264 RepID=T1JQG7_TETUR